MKKASAPRRPASKRKRKRKIEHPTIEETIKIIDSLKAPTPEVAKAFELFKSWLADESGYDEETWPQLKRALRIK